MVVIELIEISHREGKGWSLKNGEKGPALLVVDRTVGVGFSRPPAFHGPTCPAERGACHNGPGRPARQDAELAG